MSLPNRLRPRSPRERTGTLADTGVPPPPASPARDDERPVVRALRARNEAAFEALLDRYYPSMLRIARAYVRSHEVAEEVVQDTWLAVLSGIDRFEARSSLRTWIYRILINRARTRARREARFTPLSSLPAPPGARHGSGPGPAAAPPPDPAAADAWGRSAAAEPAPDARLLASELHGRIEEAIRALPPRQQEVITLRDIEGWAPDEVCRLLEISEANQRVLLHRARTKVRDALADYLDATGPAPPAALAAPG